MIARVTAILLFLSCILLPQAQAEPTRQGVVSWVFDGDTLEIAPFGKVRLIGIDTPEQEDSVRDRYLLERGVSRTKQRQISRAARQFNIEIVKGKTVTLAYDAETRDRHGRLLAYVYLPDGRLLNLLLLERGLAVVYRRFDFRMKEEYLAAEEQARRMKLGVWQLNNSARADRQ